MATVRLEWVNGIERSTVVPCLIVTHLIRTPCYFGWLSLSLGKALTFSLLKKLNLGEQGWHSGESTRLPPCGPGLNPGVDAICGLSLLLVLSLALRGFSPGTPVFLSR